MKNRSKVPQMAERVARDRFLGSIKKLVDFQGAELSEIDEAEIENLKGELEKTLGREVVERSLSKPESVRSNIR